MKIFIPENAFQKVLCKIPPFCEVNILMNKLKYSPAVLFFLIEELYKY